MKGISSLRVTKKVMAQPRVVLNEPNIDDSKKCVFPTQSEYVGQWNRLLMCMDGFGLYKFPDGSTYRGFFKNGLFHGYGCVKLVNSDSLDISGIFENGRLVSINDMKFKDGVPFTAEFTENGVDMSNWQHLRHVYKQTCPDIMERNIKQNVQSCPSPVLDDCKLNKREFHQHYLGTLCAGHKKEKQKTAAPSAVGLLHKKKEKQKTAAPSADEPPICSSRSTLNNSFSTETILDQRLLQHCADLIPDHMLADIPDDKRDNEK